jgi:hypothetical protein
MEFPFEVRSLATLGWLGPKLASSMASARRISGSASENRLVSLSNAARLNDAEPLLTVANPAINRQAHLFRLPGP